MSNFLQDMIIWDIGANVQAIQNQQAHQAASNRAALGLLNMSNHLGKIQATLKRTDLIIDGEFMRSFKEQLFDCREQYHDFRYIIDPPPESPLERFLRKRRRRLAKARRDSGK